jgi:hypothetical protein
VVLVPECPGYERTSRERPPCGLSSTRAFSASFRRSCARPWRVLPRE